MEGNGPDKSGEVPHVDSGDEFLKSLVHVMNANPSISLGITLTIGGLIVSGDLASRTEYVDAFSSMLSSTSDPQDAEAFRREMRETFGTEADYQDDEETAQTIAFIHIRNARFYNAAGSAIPSSGGSWWRGRVCQVDGFTIGALVAA